MDRYQISGDMIPYLVGVGTASLYATGMYFLGVLVGNETIDVGTAILISIFGAGLIGMPLSYLPSWVIDKQSDKKYFKGKMEALENTPQYKRVDQALNPKKYKKTKE